jgi:hypothetical protein
MRLRLSFFMQCSADERLSLRDHLKTACGVQTDEFDCTASNDSDSIVCSVSEIPACISANPASLVNLLLQIKVSVERWSDRKITVIVEGAGVRVPITARSALAA